MAELGPPWGEIDSSWGQQGNICGCTKVTLRKRDLVHASGSLEEAKAEIALWFNENELYDYSDLNEKYTR